MKKGIVVSIIAILLLATMFQYRIIKRYEKTLTNTYELHVGWAESFGQYDVSRHIDQALISINREDYYDLIKHLGNLSTSFSVAEAAYSFMGTYLDMKAKNRVIVFSYYISWFYRDMNNYIHNTINEIQKSEFDKEKLIDELTQLKEAFEYIETRITRDLLNYESIHEINITWTETIEKILLNYPEHPGFMVYREKYYRSLIN